MYRAGWCGRMSKTDVKNTRNLHMLIHALAKGCTGKLAQAERTKTVQYVENNYGEGIIGKSKTKNSDR